MRKRSVELLLIVYLHLYAYSYTQILRAGQRFHRWKYPDTNITEGLPTPEKHMFTDATLNVHAHPRMCHILVHTCCMPSGMSCTSCMPMCTPSRHVMNIMHVYVQMHTHLMFPSEHPCTRAHILMCVCPCGCPLHNVSILTCHLTLLLVRMCPHMWTHTYIKLSINTIAHTHMRTAASSFNFSRS